jgi:hypothetical protein
MVEVLREFGEQANRYIDANTKVLDTSGQWLQISAYLAVSAPFIGAIVQGLVWIFR